jgi:hypothetical protein
MHRLGSNDGGIIQSASIAAERQPERIPLQIVIKPWQQRSSIMRGALLWLVGIPIPIIILLYLFNVV